MHNGKTIESADSKELFNNPKENYTKSLLNSSKQKINDKDEKKLNENTLIEINNINKEYILPGSKKLLRAVKNVSLKLSEGEIFGIAGESGSGKTTVANLLMGLTELSSGKIIFLKNLQMQYYVGQFLFIMVVQIFQIIFQ